MDYRRRLTEAEHARATQGVVPDSMDDKWFIFYEEPWLWFHRSWTGLAIWGVKLRATADGSEVEEAWSNRAPEQYRETDAAHDAALLSFVIERVVLGRSVPFPVRSPQR